MKNVELLIIGAGILGLTIPQAIVIWSLGFLSAYILNHYIKKNNDRRAQE